MGIEEENEGVCGRVVGVGELVDEGNSVTIEWFPPLTDRIIPKGAVAKPPPLAFALFFVSYAF